MGEQKNPISSIYKAKREIVKKKKRRKILPERNEIEAWRGKTPLQEKRKENGEIYRKTDVARRGGWKETWSREEKKHGLVDC